MASPHYPYIAHAPVGVSESNSPQLARMDSTLPLKCHSLLPFLESSVNKVAAAGSFFVTAS